MLMITNVGFKLIDRLFLSRVYTYVVCNCVSRYIYVHIIHIFYD